MDWRLRKPEAHQKIQLRVWGGIVAVEGSQLVIRAEGGWRLKEGLLVARQADRLLPSSWQVCGETVGFVVSGYQGDQPLLIDLPVRAWGTYYGGGAADYATDMATDQSGNVYVTGYTASPVGIATSGAHQDTLGGNLDAFLAKLSPDGVLQWATYYGGLAGIEG